MSAGHNGNDSRRLLVERVASSRHINRSARLRDMLVYLTERVFEGDVEEIHEQEVGNKVFGRSPNYDTASDNIVRVHASMLRKRLEQYFASEGADEKLILEIPKGNYAPVFRERNGPVRSPSEKPAQVPRTSRLIPVLAGLAVLFFSSTVWLLLRRQPAPSSQPPAVRLFWSQLFHAGRQTDIVLDDAAVGLFQELTGRPLTLSDYFDRGYLRSLPERTAGTNLSQPAASSLVLRRHSSFANISMLWKLAQLDAIDPHATLRFARDYSFRDLKADNALLLGNSHLNPWMEPFLPRIGIRWNYDSSKDVYYPVDTWDSSRSYQNTEVNDTHEGYCAISLLPNLGGNGTVLIISATGGSALNACGEFLADEHALSEIRRRLSSPAQVFPRFESLIKLKGRSSGPRDATIVLCRAVR